MVRFIVICLLVMGSGRAAARPVLAFGDLRGHLEPCGCDPRTDVGGVRRVAAAVARYRAITPDVLVINSGNNLSVGSKDTPEDRAITQALRVIRPEASLVNEIEWNMLRSGKSLPEVSWVLSNLREAKFMSRVSEVVTAGNREIFGYVGISDKSLLPANRALIAHWRKLTKTADSSRRVLIFSGSNKELAFFKKSAFFDVIISSNTTKLGVEMGDQEQRNERLLLRDVKGETLGWSVPFGGGGLLRLGGLEKTAIPQTLEGSLRAGSSLTGATSRSGQGMPFPGGISGLPEIRAIHWLRVGEEAGVSDEITKIFDMIRAEAGDQFKKLVDARERDLKTSEFAGAEACVSCHKTAYNVWAASKHASAMLSLRVKSRQEDPPCVECHVLGYTAKGGFVSEEKSPQFSNVQCENCHGPRKAHVANPTLKVAGDANESCAACHTPPHSPGFDRKSYWKSIEHR